jgi:hypothetical protein
MRNHDAAPSIHNAVTAIWVRLNLMLMNGGRSTQHVQDALA